MPVAATIHWRPREAVQSSRAFVALAIPSYVLPMRVSTPQPSQCRGFEGFEDLSGGRKCVVQIDTSHVHHALGRTRKAYLTIMSIISEQRHHFYFALRTL